MTEVLDFFGPHDPEFYRCIKASGSSGVARYLTNSSSDPRQITPQEVVDAHAAGLEIHFAYEMNSTYAAYFTFAQGAEDCRQAQARLVELGAPDGTVVYFAVDAPASTIPVSLLDDYFNGVESVVTPSIVPGIYGFQAHVDYARRQFPNVGKHTWQTYGTPNGPLDLFQHLQEARCGVSVDVNEATVTGWKGQDMTRDEVIALLAEYGLTPDKGKVPAIDATLGNFSFRINALEHGTPAVPTSPAPTQPVIAPSMPTIYLPGQKP